MRALVHALRKQRTLSVVSWVLRVVTAAALAVDSYVHADLADRYDPNSDASISQGDLFRIEAAVSALAAFVIVLVATRVTWTFVFAVAASALGAVLLYRYHDVGTLGPLPNMYEPSWYQEKSLTAIAEAVATAAAALGYSTTALRLRRTAGSARGSPRISPVSGRGRRG